MGLGSSVRQAYRGAIFARCAHAIIRRPLALPRGAKRRWQRRWRAALLRSAARWRGVRAGGAAGT